jgi:hypothetical protein
MSTVGLAILMGFFVGVSVSFAIVAVLAVILL